MSREECVSLRFALLGQLNKRSMTGYELKQFFDQAISHFWAADHTQIYRTLNQLEAEGLVTAATEIQTERPNRRRYSLTPAGREALDAWLATPQPRPSFRDPFLIQLFFAHSLPMAQIVAMIEARQRAHEEQARDYLAIEGLIEQTAGSAREALLEQLTLELGIAIEQTYARWAEQAIARLQQSE